MGDIGSIEVGVSKSVEAVEDVSDQVGIDPVNGPVIHVCNGGVMQSCCCSEDLVGRLQAADDVVHDTNGG